MPIYPVPPSGMPERTIVLMGDSIEGQHGGTGPYIGTPYLTSSGYFNWANVLLGHRLLVLSNAGKEGDTTAGMLARFNAEVLAYEPGWVLIKGGTNDVGQDVSAASMQANLQAMYDRAKARGIRVIAVTIPPRTGLTAPQRVAMVTVNQWIRQTAARDPWLVLADVGQAIVDNGTTWQPLTGMTGDGVHLYPEGAARMGRRLAAILDPIVPPVDILTSGHNSDATNYLLNGVFNGSGSTLANNWTAGGGSATISYVPRTDGIVGNWMQMVVANGSSYTIQNNTLLSAGLAVGDSVEFLVEVQVENLNAAPAANTQAFQALCKPWNGSSFTAIRADCYWDSTIPNSPFPGSAGVFRTNPLVIPSGTTIVTCIIQMNNGGTYRVARAALRKVV